MSNGWPCDPNTRITQYFGEGANSFQPDGHTGMDFALPIGSPVYAVADGTVLHASWSQELGWPNPFYIAIDFDGPANGDQSGGIVVVIDHGSFVSISAHLNDEGLNNGDRVTRGQIIGRSGNTGRSSGPHLHFEILPDGWNVHAKFYGRVNPLDYISETVAAPVAPAVGSDQRVTNAPVNYRTAPNTNADTFIQEFPKDTILDFKGYVTNGASVQDNSVWFVGKYTNGYAWSGGFVNSSTDGLPNLTPAAPPAPTPAPAPSLAVDQRVTNAPVNYRTAPKTGTDTFIQEFPKDVILDFKGYITNGQSVEDNSVWFVGKYSDGYAWSGGFVNSSTDGLQNLTPTTVPTPVPTTPVITPPIYKPPVVDTFKGDLPCITEWIPAGEGNFEEGNFPTKPTHAVIHDFGSHGRDTYITTVNHFKNGNRANPSASHFVVSGKKITQMVKLKNRAYHGGPSANMHVGIEVDPEIFTGSALGEETKASVILLLKQLNEYYGYKLQYFEHNQFMNTLCGDDIELSWFENLDGPITTPTQPVTPAVTASLEDIAKHVEEFATLIRNLKL